MIRVTIFLCSIFCFGIYLRADESTSDSVRSVLANQAKAWNDGNIDKFMADYWKSEKLTFSSGGETTRGWQPTYDRFQTKYKTAEDMGKLEFKDLEVTELVDAALVLGKWHVTRKHDDFGGNFTLLFRKIDKRWLIVHDHTSLLEKEK